MGDNKMAWKVRVKTEEELFMDKHKPGKIRKLFTGVFVFVCIAVALFVGYKYLVYEEPDEFLELLEKGDYEDATKIFDFEKNYDKLVEAILEKRIEYDKTDKKEVFDDMWELIFRFESQIRVSDKTFYEDLKYFPKEKKVIKLGCKVDDSELGWHSEEYYNVVLGERYYDDSQLYDYYVKVEIVDIADTEKIEEGVDILIDDKGLKLINKENNYAKKFIEIIEEKRIEDAEVGYYGETA